jgi:two-component system response regulator FixJ
MRLLLGEFLGSRECLVRHSCGNKNASPDSCDVEEVAPRDCPVVAFLMIGHGEYSISDSGVWMRYSPASGEYVDSLTQPQSIDEGFRRLSQEATGERRADAEVRLQALTPRERDVLDGLAQGLPNKTIAYDLGISPRTVEIHRANLMAKLGVRSLSEALRIAFAAGGE